ncbi:hypothetical protein JCM3770_003705 [Rhodotorula araucariae]
MLKLTLIALAGVATVLADDGRLALTNDKVEQEAYSDLELKEVCYRNLYADLDDFDVKHSIETVVSDKKGQTVFLSDGIKRDFKDKEYYYEEFCYKKFKAREHDKDVEHAHGLLVGRQVDPSNAVLSSSFSDDVGDVAGSSADDVLAGGNSDSSALIERDYSSLLGLGGLNNFSAGGGLGAAGDDDKHDEAGSASGLFAPDGVKSDNHEDVAGDKKADDGKSEEPVGDGKAYGTGNNAGAEHKDEGVTKRAFVSLRRLLVARA